MFQVPGPMEIKIYLPKKKTKEKANLLGLISKIRALLLVILYIKKSIMKGI